MTSFGLVGIYVAIAQLSFPVVVRNFGEVPTSSRKEAQATVDALFRPIGVQVRWVTPEDLRRELTRPPESPCEFAQLVKVNLIAPQAEFELPRDVLGTATPAAGYVRIAARRIADRALRAHVPMGTVLGEVMAHEIGHVFLPNAPHSSVGLMMESLDVGDATSARLTIDPQRAAQMRTTIRSKQTACSR